MGSGILAVCSLVDVKGGYRPPTPSPASRTDRFPGRGLPRWWNPRINRRTMEPDDAFRYNAEPVKDFPVYLGLGLVLVMGLGLFLLGARNLRRAVASPHWPTASATVVESSTSIDVTPPSRSLRRSSRNSVSSIMYTANIRFQYQVNG